MSASSCKYQQQQYFYSAIIIRKNESDRTIPTPAIRTTTTEKIPQIVEASNNNSHYHNVIIHDQYLLRPDPIKKSVFWLDPPSSSSCSTSTTTATSAAGCHVILDSRINDFVVLNKQKDDGNKSTVDSTYIQYECILHCQDQIIPIESSSNRDEQQQKQQQNYLDACNSFMIGGFQLVSNAKQVQVFLTTTTSKNRPGETSSSSELITNNDTQEILLTTVTGIAYNDNKIDNSNINSSATTTSNDDATATSLPLQVKLFKAQCVIPGGPRLVRHVRLVFQTLIDNVNDSSNSNSLALNHKQQPIPLYLNHVRWTIRSIVSALPISAEHEVVPSSTNNEANTNHPSLFLSSNSNIQPSLPETVAPTSSSLLSSSSQLQQHNTFSNNTHNRNGHSSNNNNNNEVMMALSGMAISMRSMEERIQQLLSKSIPELQRQQNDMTIKALLHDQELQQQQQIVTSLKEQIKSLSTNVQKIGDQQEVLLANQKEQSIVLQQILSAIQQQQQHQANENQQSTSPTKVPSVESSSV